MKTKLKNLSSLKKRVKITATGKFVHCHSGTSHNNRTKNSRRKRFLHRPAIVDETKVKALKRLLPYS